MTMKRVSIVIPAHNEEQRIGKTLNAYAEFFLARKQAQELDFELLVVLNGCRDATQHVVKQAQELWGECVRFIALEQAGKGIAIKAGFLDALQRNNDLIGFVDADMATRPHYFNELCVHARDGVIASRYMPGAYIEPSRPTYKRIGSRLVYESLVRLLFGLRYYDYQCGAKIFARRTLEAVAHLLTVDQWAFDVELLYLCKKHNFVIHEIPTVWYDQAGSKLQPLKAGMRMLGSLINLRMRHW